MEAARTLTHLPERMRMHRFVGECEDLRPLGIAYALSHFGRSLDRADAEDAVAEVIIRLVRNAEAGRPPERLRPAFLTSVRNACLDQLRYRSVRPVAPLEAAEEATTTEPGPEQYAEAHEDLARLREALARMRPNYREALVLRFGLGLTVPEIAERLHLSLPAAKKIVLRSTAQMRKRMEAIEGRRFCPEMRELAERSVLDGELAGIAEGPGSAAIKAHLSHCGPCRGFLASLRADLHELGGTVLLGGLAAGKLGLVGRLAAPFHAAAHALQAGTARVRLASYRAAGAFSPEGAGPTGLLAGSGQKIAAACTAGAAGAATCLATGIVGPGIAIGPSPHAVVHPSRPVAHVRRPNPTLVHHPQISYSAAEGEVEGTGSETSSPVVPQPRGGSTSSAAKPSDTSTKPKPRSSTAEPEAKTPEQTEQSEFGFEEQAASASPAPEESSAPVTDARPVETTTQSSPAPESSKSAGGASSTGGHDEFGFGG
ncbi:MAG TPA: sigma-70 family RNA polymerase sigma factor [Solirubrobacterales bacterium]|jgi:RNA polymerase sigma-70 factor (ECF subfamily)|nr:sigma-70 family RNA polymerase sigma factor [Solirubrobacterales bacterium]